MVVEVISMWVHDDQGGDTRAVSSTARRSPGLAAATAPHPAQPPMLLPTQWDAHTAVCCTQGEGVEAAV